MTTTEHITLKLHGRTANDYSYADLVSFEDDNSAAAITHKVTLYAGDKLIWGTEPDGTTAGNAGDFVVPHENEEGTTTTTKPSGTTTTTTKPTGTTTTTSDPNGAGATGNDKVAYGDANCDGSVDMADAVLIMQSLANPDKYGLNGTSAQHITEQGLANADCDLTSEGLSNNDALAIQMFLLNKGKLPVK